MNGYILEVIGRDYFDFTTLGSEVAIIIFVFPFGLVKLVEEGSEMIVVLVLHLCYFINLEYIRMYFKSEWQFQFLKTSQQHFQIAIDLVYTAGLFCNFL